MRLSCTPGNYQALPESRFQHKQLRKRENHVEKPRTLGLTAARQHIQGTPFGTLRVSRQRFTWQHGHRWTQDLFWPRLRGREQSRRKGSQGQAGAHSRNPEVFKPFCAIVLKAQSTKSKIFRITYRIDSLMNESDAVTYAHLPTFWRGLGAVPLRRCIVNSCSSGLQSVVEHEIAGPQAGRTCRPTCWLNQLATLLWRLASEFALQQAHHVTTICGRRRACLEKSTQQECAAARRLHGSDHQTLLRRWAHMCAGSDAV